MYPEEVLGVLEFARMPPLDLSVAAEPHVVLASLPLPVLVPTNYDDSMFRALIAAGKGPHREMLSLEPQPCSRR